MEEEWLNSMQSFLKRKARMREKGEEEEGSEFDQRGKRKNAESC